MKRFLLGTLLAGGAVATPAHALTATSTPDTAYAYSGEIRVDNSRTARRGAVRSSFTLPASWRRRGPIDAGAVGFVAAGCGGFRVTFTARLTETAASTSTAERAAAAVPRVGTDAFHSGTRQSAAWRVSRISGGPDVRGVLVQPLVDRNAPAGRRLYSQTSVVAESAAADCSIGNTRVVADTLARALAAGRAGGFSFDRTLPSFRFRLSRSDARRITTRPAGLSASLTLPAKWPRRPATAVSLRVGPLGSCRIQASLIPRVTATDETAAARAAALAPGNGRYVLGAGTSDDLVFRVVRDGGSTTVRGAAVRRIADGRLAEVVAVATADQATECHSGGPRSVGDALASAFAGATLGAG